MLRTRHLLLATPAAAILLLSACGEDYPDAYTATADEPAVTRASAPQTTVRAEEVDVVESFPANGTVEEVWAIDNTYRLADIEVDAGTEVLWINRGRNEHDVVPVDDSADWGVGEEAFVPGDEYGHVFDTPGVYDYYCTLHATKDAGMIGRVVVVEPES